MPHSAEFWELLMSSIDRVLVVGATGRTGRHVVDAAAGHGLSPLALARNEARARETLPGTEIVTGDLTGVDSLTDAVRAKVAEGGTHMDFYDVPKYVDQAIVTATPFFTEHLTAQPARQD
ncbi:NAD(P)H-binding protein [Streptomyces sp. Tu 4128]|uniref:NAD(P)H-binding protein n=2 Tax=unclassified Streptomyces TaxID=2593676 RepID=UPI0019D03F77|nr:NAD(P)H-binding protein [Streptomyces sp. Tu 4128]